MNTGVLISLLVILQVASDLRYVAIKNFVFLHLLFSCLLQRWDLPIRHKNVVVSNTNVWSFRLM